jgi:agmatine deiminase
MLRPSLLLLFLCLVPTLAAAGDLTFPPEWEPHEAVWLGWTEDPRPHDLQLRMIEAMEPHVRIRLLVESAAARAAAEDSLMARSIDPERVEYIRHDVRTLWIRDPGPRFLSDGRRLAVADLGWSFYGFPPAMIGDGLRQGGLDDDLAAELGLPLVSTSVVAEGGALEASSSCLLGYADVARQRNPGLSLAEIEREYLRVYGKRRMIWLDRCPLSDRVEAGPRAGNWFGFGANGHIDEYVRFVNDSTLVIAQIDSLESLADPVSRLDFGVLRENLAQLRAARDAAGRPFRVVALPVPAPVHLAWTGPLTEAHRRAPLLGAMVGDLAIGEEIHVVPAASYLNFFVTNGVVLVPSYWHEGGPESLRAKDERVRAVLAGLFPGRAIVQLDPLVINWGGGGMHCITQQQPALDR